jgi:hypothetical protein
VDQEIRQGETRRLLKARESKIRLEFFSLEKMPYFWIIKLKTKRSFFIVDKLQTTEKSCLTTQRKSWFVQELSSDGVRSIPISPWSSASNSWVMKTDKTPNTFSAILLGKFFTRTFLFKKLAVYLSQ